MSHKHKWVQSSLRKIMYCSICKIVHPDFQNVSTLSPEVKK